LVVIPKKRNKITKNKMFFNDDMWIYKLWEWTDENSISKE